ncbi:MAG: hypothetical protein CVU46_13285 [Chloroflexi bacterium HGW-Chloroflexi-8]|nr:MAG: hypothetical protein CVU46_13285 [Chloroflexi bacterium HGW-Chloroflexi-8]
MYRLGILVFFLLLAGCSSGTQSENPKWVDRMIHQFESEPVGNPPQSIWRYEYQGQIVYYVPPQCCDQFSSLYDAGGDVICAPDGGLTGSGDGRCKDFISQRTAETLIWEDPGTR